MDSQVGRDAEHLRLLTIFHYIVAALMLLWGSLPIIHSALGAAMVFGLFPPNKSGQGPPAMVGWLFMIMGGTFVLFGWTLAAATFFAGRSLAARRRYIFCLITSAVMAITCMPMGTLLGVFTILVLARPTVKELFKGGASA